MLAPATLAALQSTRAIETRLLPNSLAATHRGFAFYVTFPKRSIPSMSHASPRLRSLIASLAANASPARTLTKIARSMISRQRGGGVVDSKLVMS